MNAQRFSIPISGWLTPKAGSPSSESSFGPDDFECELKIRLPQASPDHKPPVRFPAPRWARNIRITAGIVLAAFLSLCSVGLADRTITLSTGDDTNYFGVVDDGGTWKLGVLRGIMLAKYTMDTGVLRVYGREGNDHIEAVSNAERDGVKFADIAHLTYGRTYIFGDLGDDVLIGSTKTNYLYGGEGNDLLLGGASRDMLYGGPGNDYLSGGNGDDELYGEDGNDFLMGDQGNDYISGGAGNDTLIGGTGDGDQLDGGTGYDKWLCREVPAGDLIADWDGDDAATDANDTKETISIEIREPRNPYLEWAPMARYGHGIINYHETTSNPNLLLADRAGGAVLLFSSGGDLPVTGDFDGDGYNDDLAVFHPSPATWYYDYDHNRTTDAAIAVTWGEAGDLPVAGDFDRDGRKNDMALFRPSTGQWSFDCRRDLTVDFESPAPWGGLGCLPIAGDFDGDGEFDDVGVFQAKTGRWHFDYDCTARTDESSGPWRTVGVPLHATHKQYGNSCGPTSLNMVFEHLGMAHHNFRRWFPRDLSQPNNTIVPSSGWPSTAVDAGYHLSMEHIMWEGFYHKRQTESDWTESPQFLSADGWLNTSDAGQDGSFYDIRYDLGHVDWNPDAGEATGPVQKWLENCPGLGWDERNQQFELAYVANKFSEGLNDALPVSLTLGVGPGRNFRNVEHIQEVIMGFINHGIPLVVAVENGGHFNTIIGYWRLGTTFYVYTAEPLDGYGRPFYCKPMRWRRIRLDDDMLRNGSCTLVAILLYGHSIRPGVAADWARSIDSLCRSSLLCGYLRPIVHAIRRSTDNAPVLQAETAPNVTYVLEAAPHLNAPIPWTPILTNQASTNSLIEFIEADARRFPQRFYRLLSVAQ